MLYDSNKAQLNGKETGEGGIMGGEGVTERERQGRETQRTRGESERENCTLRRFFTSSVLCWSLSVCTVSPRDRGSGGVTFRAHQTHHISCCVSLLHSHRWRHVSGDKIPCLIWISLPESDREVCWKWTLKLHVGLRAFMIRVGAAPASPSTWEVWPERAEGRLPVFVPAVHLWSSSDRTAVHRTLRWVERCYPPGAVSWMSQLSF